MHAKALLPRYPVPALNVPLINGGRFVLGAESGERFDLVVFYRGLLDFAIAKDYPARGEHAGEV